MKQFSPRVTPQTMVAFAPMELPRRTRVGRNLAGGFLKATRGFMSLVKTMFGPRNTSSSTVTLSQTSTQFLTVTWLPIRAPLSMKAWSPTLQSLPMTAPFMTWAKAQTRVPAPMASDSHRARSCTKTDGSSATSGDRFPQLVRHPLLLLRRDLREERQREDLAGRLLGHRER